MKYEDQALRMLTKAPSDDVKKVRILLGLGCAIILAYRGLFRSDLYQSLADHTEGAVFFEPASSPPIWILGLTGWMLLNRRWEYSGSPAPPRCISWLSILSFLCATVFYFWAYYTSATDLLFFSLGFFLVGTGGLLGGTRGARAVLLPAVFLLFAYPLPAVLMNRVILSLQWAAVDLSMGILGLLDIEAIVMGDLIYSKEHMFQVIESCSGFRSIATLTMSAVLYGELFRLGIWNRILILCAAPVLAFYLNGVRIVSIVLNPSNTTHTTQGVVVLVGGILLIASLSTALEKLIKNKRKRKVVKRYEFNTSSAGIAAGLCAVLFIGSFVCPVWEKETLNTIRLQGFPQNFGAWKGKGEKVDWDFLGSVRFYEEVSMVYKKSGHKIHAFIGTDDYIDRRRSLISEKTILFWPGVRVLEKKNIQVGEDGRPAVMYLNYIPRLKRYELVYHWRHGTESFFEEVMRAIFALDRSLFRRRESGYIVRLSTDLSEYGPTEKGVESGQERLSGFAVLIERTIDRLEKNRKSSR